MKKSIEKVTNRTLKDMVERKLREEYPCLNVSAKSIVNTVFKIIEDIIKEYVLRLSPDTERIRIELLNSFYYEGLFQKSKKIVSNLTGEKLLPDMVKVKSHVTDKYKEDINEHYKAMRV